MRVRPPARPRARALQQHPVERVVRRRDGRRQELHGETFPPPLTPLPPKGGIPVRYGAARPPWFVNRHHGSGASPLAGGARRIRMLSGTMPRRRPRTAAPPLIGVVTHELREDRVPAWAAMPGRSERDLAPARLSLRLSYTQALQEAGAIAVVLPAHGYVDDAAALLDRVDGLLVSGGPDLDPAVYGQAPHPSARARRRPRRRRVRAGAAARRRRARPAAARHLPRAAGAERLARRDAAPAHPGPSSDDQCVRARARGVGRARLAPAAG